MKKRILIVTLLIFAANCLFCIGIKNMSDWEKEIKKLDSVESVEIEKLYPNDDESDEYNLKIFLTGDRYLQLSFFNPYRENNRAGEFYVERIGNIVPIAWGYDFYILDMHILKLRYITFFNKSTKTIIDLLNDYDKVFEFVQNLPVFDKDFHEEFVDNSFKQLKNKKPVFEFWNNALSPYIYSNYIQNKYYQYWEEYKLFKMTVKEYNDYVLSRGWNFHVLGIEP